MKYDISNLDKFKGHINPITDLMQDIAIMETNNIEDKIKELISPYIDLNVTENELIRLIQESKYKLGHVVHIDYEEYYIINTINDNKDYFLTRHNVNLKELKSWVSISEIVRGISDGKSL